MLAAGQIRRLPRLVAVQAARCAPVAQALAAGQAALQPVEAEPTIAEGIAVAAPLRGGQMLNVLRRTGGEAIVVSEQEIAQSLRAWWRLGYALEPTAAATLAGLARYVQQGGHQQETIVSTITGHGLKAMAPVEGLLV